MAGFPWFSLALPFSFGTKTCLFCWSFKEASSALARTKTKGEAHEVRPGSVLGRCLKKAKWGSLCFLLCRAKNDMIYEYVYTIFFEKNENDPVLGIWFARRHLTLRG